MLFNAPNGYNATVTFIKSLDYKNIQFTLLLYDRSGIKKRDS